MEGEAGVSTLGDATGAGGCVVVPGEESREKERRRMSARDRYALRMGGPNSSGIVGVETGGVEESRESMSSAV
jgi:acyl-CoA synthetase (NDP forming)